MVNWGKLIFGGVDSSEYGIYITGEAVYNAPERDVEFIEVPGRNGSIAMDKGRYNNISVTYPAGTFGKTQEEFRESLGEFRNAILSQVGYQRLEDSYHPEEYRLGVYASGLEVSAVGQGQAGEFDLTFECKPQRFLTIGDYPIPIESGDTLQNPTVFDSSPLLEVEGYGTVSFNGFDIELDDSPLGVVDLIPRHMYGEEGMFTKTYTFDRSLLNTGDDIYVGQAMFECTFGQQSYVYASRSYQISGVSTMTPTVSIGDGGSMFVVTIYTPMISFSALAEGAQEVEKIASVSVAAVSEGGTTDTAYVTVRIKCGYDYITFRVETAVSSSSSAFKNAHNEMTTTAVQGDSTIDVLGNPTYVDCETGEAYHIENDEYKSSNARVAIGADLPTLSPGVNKVTFDNTITDLKIAPRWWKI